MPSKTELRLDYLQTIQAQKAASDSLVNGARMIVEGGPELLKEAVNSDPEIVLAALAGMALVIDKAQTQILEVTESWFAAEDQTTALLNSIARNL